MKTQDELDKLLKQIDELEPEIEAKLEGRSTGGRGLGRGQAIEGLRICLEQLRVASEELRHQNEVLAQERQRYVDLFNFAPGRLPRH